MSLELQQETCILDFQARTHSALDVSMHQSSGARLDMASSLLPSAASAALTTLGKNQLPIVRGSMFALLRPILHTRFLLPSTHTLIASPEVVVGTA